MFQMVDAQKHVIPMIITIACYTTIFLLISGMCMMHIRKVLFVCISQFQFCFNLSNCICIRGCAFERIKTNTVVHVIV